MTDEQLAFIAADLQETVSLLAVLCDPDEAGGGAWKVSVGGRPAALVQRRTASWIDRTAEQAAHRLAAAAGLSPRLLHARPDLRLVLTEWVESETTAVPAGAAMAARLAEVHALPVDTWHMAGMCSTGRRFQRHRAEAQRKAGLDYRFRP
ncbi:MAG: hypothetical protein AAGF46_07620, partial [Pseudomonadota bacterium]